VAGIFQPTRITRLKARSPILVLREQSSTARAAIRDVLASAYNMPKTTRAHRAAETVLRGLIGAALPPPFTFACHLFEEPVPRDRPADFIARGAAIHVVDVEFDLAIQSCRRDLDAGRRAIIMTVEPLVPGYQTLAETAELDRQIEVVDAEQFVTFRIWASANGRQERTPSCLAEFFQRYNDIMASFNAPKRLSVVYGTW